MDINATLLGQMLVFGVLIWFSWKFIWPPLTKAIVDQAHKREVEIVDEARSTAMEEGKRIVDSSRQDAAQEKSRARDELRKDVASLAVAGASRLLQREIDPKAHADLIEQLAREIEGAKA